MCIHVCVNERLHTQSLACESLYILLTVKPILISSGTVETIGSWVPLIVQQHIKSNRANPVVVTFHCSDYILSLACVNLYILLTVKPILLCSGTVESMGTWVLHIVQQHSNGTNPVGVAFHCYYKNNAIQKESFC